MRSEGAAATTEPISSRKLWGILFEVHCLYCRLLDREQEPLSCDCASAIFQRMHVSTLIDRAKHSSPGISKECAMQNGRNRNMNTRQPGTASFAPRSQKWASNAPPAPQSSHNAQRNYERYLALAQAEVRAGNTIAAENYYQHAEHYFRSMSGALAPRV